MIAKASLIWQQQINLNQNRIGPQNELAYGKYNQFLLRIALSSVATSSNSKI